MKKAELTELELQIDRALRYAAAIDQKLAIYLLTMAKLDIAQQIEKLPDAPTLSMLPSVPLIPRPSAA